MPRTLLAVLLLCAIAPAAVGCPLTLGAHVGSSIPDLRDNGGNEFSTGYSTRIAPYGGVYAELGLTPVLSVQAELNVVPQGGKRDGLQPIAGDALGFPGTTFYARFKNVAKLDYIELPVLAKLHFGPEQRLFLAAGPYLGYLLSAQSVASGQSTVYTDAQGTSPLVVPPGVQLPPVDLGSTTDNLSSLHRVNWGVQMGTGLSQPLGPGLLSVDLRGGIGLTNLQKDTAADGKNITGDLVVAVGYGFRVGGRGH